MSRLIPLMALLLLSGCVSPPTELRREPMARGRIFQDPSSGNAQARLEEEIEREIARQEIPALQIAIRGPEERLGLAFGTVDPERREPITPDDGFRVGSVTKLYTATIILSLVEEGRISLESTVEG